MTPREIIARAACCPRVCRNGDEPYSICQKHTFLDEADAILSALEGEGMVIVPIEQTNPFLINAPTPPQETV